MALKIRMARAGAKKRPFYQIVVADSRSPRDGRFIEKLGTYNPMLAKDHPERVKLTHRARAALARRRCLAERARRALPRRCRLARQARDPRDAETIGAAQESAGARRGGDQHGAGRAPRRRQHRQERRVKQLRLDPMARPDRVLMGAIIGAHGVRGQVRVKSFAAAPKDIASYGPLEDARGRAYKLMLKGGADDVLIAAIDGRDRPRPGGDDSKARNCSCRATPCPRPRRRVLSRRSGRPRSPAQRRHGVRHGARGARFRRRRQS